MNPLAALIAMMVALKNDLYTRFNAALTKLPPMEQIEAGTVGLSAVRELDWAKQRIEQVGTDLASTLETAAKTITGYELRASEPVDIAAARLIDAMNNATGTAALAAAIAAKTHMPVEDHTTTLAAAIITAKADGEAAAKVAFAAQLADLQTVATRRAAAIEKVGLLAASALTDVDLLAENHADLLAVIEGRVARLTTAGLTAESHPKTYTSLLAVAANDAGTTEFDSRLEMILESAPVALTAATPTAPKPTSLAGTLPVTPAAKTAADTII